MTDEKKSTLMNAWENFKRVNDARLKEIERKGHADPLYDEHLSQINSALDHHKKSLDLGDAGGRLNSPPEEGVYATAFRTYLRLGMDSGFEAGLEAGSDEEGGYRVPRSMSSMITQAVFESSPIRQVASVETITSDAFETTEVVEDTTSEAGRWTALSERTEEPIPPTVVKRQIPTHELYAQPKATQKLVEDAGVDVEAWLSSKIADIFARTQNTAFITGTGVGQPRGILSFAAGTEWGQIEQVRSGVSGVVTVDGLINVFYALKEKHARRAKFLMNRATVERVRLLKQPATDQYLWQPGLTPGGPDTLLGVPVVMASDMPVAAPSSLSVAVADFQAAYQIVDRAGVRILRDPFTEKPFVKFYATTRVGGDVMNYEAIKLLSLAA